MIDKMVCAASGRTVIDDKMMYAAPDGAMNDDAVDEDELMYVISYGAMFDELVYVAPDGSMSTSWCASHRMVP